MTRHYAIKARGLLSPERPRLWWCIHYSTEDGDRDCDTARGSDVREEARALAVDAGGSVVAIDGPYETEAQALAASAGVQL